MEWLGKIIFSFIEMVLVYRFINCFLEREKKINKYIIFVILSVFACIGSYLNFRIKSNFINLFISFIQTFIILFLFKSKIITKLYTLAIYMLGSMLVEYAVIYVVGGLFNTNIVNNESFIQFFTLILYYFTKFTIIYYCSKKADAEIKPPNQHTIYIQQAFIPILSIIFMFYFVNMQLNSDGIKNEISYILIIVLSVINVTLFETYEKIEELYYENYNNMLHNQILAYRESHYREVESHQQEIRMIRHDLKNKLISILNCMTQGNIMNAKAEIGEILQEIVDLEAFIYTKNVALNAVINVKCADAEKRHIKCEFEIFVPENIKILDSEIGTMFGNILDNAIEACEKCKENARFLKLGVYCYGEAMAIYQSNSTVDEKTELVTKKEDILNHGLGLKSIDRIIQKYGGSKKTDVADYIFYLEINLWNIGYDKKKG